MSKRFNPNKKQLHRLQEAFCEAKAENDPLIKHPGDDIFVHTGSYQQVQRAHRPLVVGRKGSGKTALILGFQRENESDYLTSAKIDVVADVFPVQLLFSFFYQDFKKSQEILESRMYASDLQNYIEPSKVAAHAWSHCLRYAAVYVTAGVLLAETNSDLDEGQISTLRKARKVIASRAGAGAGVEVSEDLTSSEAVFSLLVYFFHKLQAAIDHVLDSNAGDISILLASITRQLLKSLTPDMVKVVENAASIINYKYETSQKKTLITLDKFDDFYDDFYKQMRKTEQKDERKTFLSTLLQGLVIAVRDLNRFQKFRWLDTLIAIPLDKFLELHLRERADLEHGQMLKLEWTPKELLEYVERRIAFALELDKDYPTSKSPWEILFPFEVPNGNLTAVKEHSFLYLVRHTLWRPREIQMFISAIFQEMEEQREPPDAEMFRRVVSRESQRIIRREFYEEFLGEYPGISGVFKKLENVEIQSVLSYEEICDKLHGLRIFADTDKPDEVVLRLFHMGVLGVRKPAKGPGSITQHRELVAYRFAYNCEDNDPFAQGITVVFHPMFFEFLNVQHQEPYVVNQLDWSMFQSE